MPTTKIGPCYLGVDYSVPPHELPKGALADAQNIVPAASGLPTGRSGSVKYNNISLSSRITSFHEFRSGASTRDRLCSYSTKIAKYNTVTSEFDDVITGLTSDKMLQWVNFQGKAICVNEGADAPQYWTDAATNGDLAGSPPKGLTIAQWSNRVWFGGDSTNVGTLTGSSLNDPTDYTTSTAIGYISQVIGDGNDPITGLFGYFDMLLIGKKNNIYKLTGLPATDSTTISITPVYSGGSDNVGFTSPWAITQVGNDVIFLDGYDIKSLSAVNEFGDVEYTSVIPQFREYLKGVVDQDYLQYTQFYHYKKDQQVWVSIPTGASTHFVFVLDYRFKRETGRYAFYPMADLTVNVFGSVENGSVEDIYYGDETGYVRQLDTGDNDNGSEIERFATYMISGNDYEAKSYGRHVYRKQFDDIEAFLTPTETTLRVTPYYALNLMDYTQVRTSGNYTALDTEVVTGWEGTGVKHKRIPLHGISGNTFALKLYHNQIGENFVVYPSEVNFRFKKKNLIV